MEETSYPDVNRTVMERWAVRNNIEPAQIERILVGLSGSTGARVLDATAYDQKPTFRFPDLRAIPFWDHGEFTWAAAIEAAAQQIRSEYLEFVSMHGQQQRKSTRVRKGNWSVYPLTRIGQYNTAMGAHFPHTVEALRQVPGALSCGMTYFSTIAPTTHILPHCGFTNAHLRCHLTLSTSEGCRIRVGEQVRTWQDGRLMIFDDTFEHEVWNDSDNSRTVLLFDIFHPDLSVLEMRALEYMAGLWRRAISVRGLASLVAA
ncbi:aspartyl/asparaginyl beta-hydroxylase domain-containing protein [Paucibacter sp. KCTC 42545]|uniref:aspartyl/asparaginyl beta-hydroxylase domain-containing protein n=1 Tax=Paucibacter sp. KCTC 42545 TaxID=1768242 RepID=UPI000733AB3F|nr:aspartyl/asparaginyl beta-hydroxylase domain-containing protein [Paucibacter sp. KCTC 42545]ALT79274.1 hypothetical protein AT984_20820 [Paucibacter sp. KCTC 42545]